MSKRGRLETTLTIPTGGWTGSLNMGGGAAGWTVAAGTYTITTLMTAFAAALTTAATEAITVTASLGESGTGIVTIDRTAAGTWTLTWVSTDLRTLLGFTGNLSGANTYTGTNHAQGVWLPDCPMAPKYGRADRGHYESDMAQTVSPGGVVKTHVGNIRRVLPRCRWSHITRAKARAEYEPATGGSFETWWFQTQAGQLSYFKPGAPVRLYWDADVSDYDAYYLVWDKGGTEMEPSHEEWAGLWQIEIRGYVTS